MRTSPPQRLLRLSGSRLTLLFSAALFALLIADSQQVWAASTTTTLVQTSGSVPVTAVSAGTVVTLTASVRASGVPVTAGQVNFCDASALACTDIHLVGTAQLTAAGKAAFRFRPGLGGHSYNAVFLGSTDLDASTSAATRLTVSGKIVSSATIEQRGEIGDYTLKATVAGAGGSAPAGTVLFRDTSNSNALVATAALSPGTTGVTLVNSSNPPAEVLSGSPAPPAAAGDFNGDGILDLAVADHDSGTITILLGNGDGTFRTLATHPQVTIFPASMVAADFNGDGILDLAVASSIGKVVTKLYGNGDGAFAAGPVAKLPCDPIQMVAADFNRDGNQDLAMTCEKLTDGVPSFSLVVLLGKGAQLEQPLPNGSSYLAVGDFNSDGIPDLVTSYDGLLLGKGDGTFKATAALDEFADEIPIVADFNGDGKADVAFASQPDVTVFLGNGDGNFQPALTTTADIQGYVLALGDFNGDGIPDLATITDAPNGVNMLLGKGDGTFVIPPIIPTPPFCGYPTIVAVGDVNGDGLPDLTIAGACSPLQILLAQTHSAVAVKTGVAFPFDSGAHLVQASYAGDTQYLGSTSQTVPFEANETPTITVATSSPTVSSGSPIALVAMVIGAKGVATGTATFFDGTRQLGTAQLNSSGIASLTTNLLSAGINLITASYSGDKNYSATTSMVLDFTVTKGTPILTLTTASVRVPYRNAFTLTAALSGTGIPPTGTVAFLDGTGQLGIGPLNAAGVATYTTKALSAGQHSITANYSGDSNYIPVKSAPLIVTIAKPQTATPVFSLAAGTYSSAISVAITDQTPGSTIYYALHGAKPTTASTKYTGPIKVTATETIEAIAVAEGYTQSAIVTAKFTIK